MVISKDLFATSDGEITGNIEISDNNKYIIVWKNGCLQGENSKKVKGRYYLFEDHREICKGRLERIDHNACHVANNGTFICAEYYFHSDKPKSTFYAYTCNGEPLLKIKFRANINNSAISSNGHYALCQTCNSDNRHRNLLTLFDLISSVEVWSINPPFWAARYDFHLDTGEVCLINDGHWWKPYKSLTLSLA